MNRRNIIAFIALIVIYSSCTKAVIDESIPTPPINRLVKYNPDIQGIMFNHCITCHGGAAPSGGFALTTYDQVRFYTENKNLISRINDTSDPMPPSGLLKSENRQIIEKWVADGFPEN